MRNIILSIVLLSLAACTSTGNNGRAALDSQSERFHFGDHKISKLSCSDAARPIFDNALALTYGFNYDAAEKEFNRAVSVDPECVLAYWGIAIVNGPHINFPVVTPEHHQRALAAINKAVSIKKDMSLLEKSLIAALKVRNPEMLPDDRRPLDEKYATEMSKVWAEFQYDSDVGALYAESLMNLHPWDFWTARGEAQPWTPAIIKVLERTLMLDPSNPQANHLYIHAMEASPSPEAAVVVAERLEKLVPGSSHLVHMPAHIYARIGRWEDAARTNLAAIEADAYFRKTNPRPGFYAMYQAHNLHFLAFARMMQGRSAESLRAAREMVSGVPKEFMTEFGFIADGYTVVIPEVMMRFGKWQDILNEPPPPNLPLAQTLWRFMRAVAHNALGNKAGVAEEKMLFQEAAGRIPQTATFGNNSSAVIAKIAGHVLDGEIAAKAGDYSGAVKRLTEAKNLEDTLKYDEPPDWIVPVRHALGAVLIKAGRFAEAEKAYREDLVRFPENGWSLQGLAQALEGQRKVEEAQSIRKRFEIAWSGADVQLDSSCACQASR